MLDGYRVRCVHALVVQSGFLHAEWMGHTLIDGSRRCGCLVADKVASKLVMENGPRGYCQGGRSFGTPASQERARYTKRVQHAQSLIPVMMTAGP